MSFPGFGARTPPRPQPPHPWRLAAERNQAERILRDLDIVKREEFEAVKDMARLAREENEALKTRIAALEAKLSSASPPSS